MKRRGLASHVCRDLYSVCAYVCTYVRSYQHSGEIENHEFTMASTSSCGAVWGPWSGDAVGVALAERAVCCLEARSTRFAKCPIVPKAYRSRSSMRWSEDNTSESCVFRCWIACELKVAMDSIARICASSASRASSSDRRANGTVCARPTRGDARTDASMAACIFWVGEFTNGLQQTALTCPAPSPQPSSQPSPWLACHGGRSQT